VTKPTQLEVAAAGRALCSRRATSHGHMNNSTINQKLTLLAHDGITYFGTNENDAFMFSDAVTIGMLIKRMLAELLKPNLSEG